VRVKLTLLLLTDDSSSLYILWSDRIENSVSKNSYIFACLLAAENMHLLSCYPVASCDRDIELSGKSRHAAVSDNEIEVRICNILRNIKRMQTRIVTNIKHANSKETTSSVSYEPRVALPLLSRKNGASCVVGFGGTSSTHSFVHANFTHVEIWKMRHMDVQYQSHRMFENEFHSPYPTSKVTIAPHMTRIEITSWELHSN
jgi:hypothetical protein